MRQASGALITRQPATHAAIQINEGPGWRQREFTQQEVELGSRDGDGEDRDVGTGWGSKPGDSSAHCGVGRMRGAN